MVSNVGWRLLSNRIVLPVIPPFCHASRSTRYPTPPLHAPSTAGQWWSSPLGASVENGNLLLDALESITGVSSDSRYLLKLEPGVYDIGNNSLVMKEYVDIEGSGETNTIITSAGFNTDTEATVIRR